MKDIDKTIEKKRLARTIGNALDAWRKKNDIHEDVSAECLLTHPTLYIDDSGVSHTGPLVIVDVDYDDIDEMDDDEDV